MEMPIVPEQAADKTEARWLAKSRGELGQACGWCEFDGHLIVRHSSLPCACCPVYRIFGCGCGIIPELVVYYAASEYAADAAMDVYELAVRMRSALIAEAYEVLKERGY